MKLIDDINEQCLFVNKSHPLSDNGVNRNQVINFNRWVLGDNDTLETITHTVSASYNGCQSNTLTAEQASPYSPYDIALIMDANGQTFDYTTRECPFVVNLIYAHHDNSDRTKVVENINTSPLLTYGIESTSYNIISSVKSDKTALVLPENTLWDTVTHTLRVSYQYTNGHIFTKTVQVSQTSPYTLDGITLKFAYDVSFISYVGVSQTIKVTAQYKHVDGTIKDFPTAINQYCDFVPSEPTTCDKSNWKFPKNMDMEEKTHTLQATYKGINSNVLSVIQKQPFTLYQVSLRFVDHDGVDGIDVGQESGFTTVKVIAIYQNQNKLDEYKSKPITDIAELTVISGGVSTLQVENAETCYWSYPMNESNATIQHKIKAEYEGKTSNELTILQNYSDPLNYAAPLAFFNRYAYVNDIDVYLSFISEDGGGLRETEIQHMTFNLCPYVFNSSQSRPQYSENGFGTTFPQGDLISNYWSNGHIRVMVPKSQYGNSFKALYIAYSGGTMVPIESYEYTYSNNQVFEIVDYPTKVLSDSFGITTYEQFVSLLMADPHADGSDMPLAFILDYNSIVIDTDIEIRNSTNSRGISVSTNVNFTLKLEDDATYAFEFSYSDNRTFNSESEIHTETKSIDCSGYTIGQVAKMRYSSNCGTSSSQTLVKKCHIYIYFMGKNGQQLGSYDWIDTLNNTSSTVDMVFNMKDLDHITLRCYWENY